MKVVILGAGYAGTIAANRLTKQVPDAQITVVNPRPEFVERVRLHEQLCGSGQAATALDEMLATGIARRAGEASRIGDGAVTLADGEELAFDYAIVAVGSHAQPPRGTIAIATWEGAERARAELARLTSGRTVTVIGSGLTGIETAAELGETRPDLQVRLLGTELGPSLSERARIRVRTGLERLQVQIKIGRFSTAAGAEAGRSGTIALEHGEQLNSDLNLWAIVSGVPRLIADSGVTSDADGRAVVDAFLRSVDDPRIFVVGDCAAVPGARMACATAAPQGAHAADTLARIIRGWEPKRYSMGYVGQAVSLGRHDGVIQLVHRDDSPRNLHIAGPAAAFTKERICRYAKRSSRTAAYVWMKDPGAWSGIAPALAGEAG